MFDMQHATVIKVVNMLIIERIVHHATLTAVARFRRNHKPYHTTTASQSRALTIIKIEWVTRFGLAIFAVIITAHLEAYIRQVFHGFLGT